MAANKKIVDLFDEDLNEKLEVFNDDRGGNSDGLFRVNMKATKEGKPYIAILRFVPNIKADGQLGELKITKSTHYIKLQNLPELAGYYDSPRNFNPKAKCALTTLYFNLDKSNDIRIKERAKLISYSTKYFSYVFIVEDKVVPENSGKIMIWQYGTKINAKIKSEKSGEVTGKEVNVFSWTHGKDFLLHATKLTTKDGVEYPDYSESRFSDSVTPIPYMENGKLKRATLDDNGKLSANCRDAIKNFLMSKECVLEDYEPKPLTDEQESNITEIVSYMLGTKTTQTKFQGNSQSTPTEAEPSSDDFDFDSDVVSSTDDDEDKGSSDDDFFNF